MKSKQIIEKQLQRKGNQSLVETIILAKKNEAWGEVAGILAGPRKNRMNVNLSDLDVQTKEGEKIVVSGKILSQGELTKKLKIVALDFSEKAKEKLLNAKCEVSNIIEEIKKNPEAKGIRIFEK